MKPIQICIYAMQKVVIYYGEYYILGSILWMINNHHKTFKKNITVLELNVMILLTLIRNENKN